MNFFISASRSSFREWRVDELFDIHLSVPSQTGHESWWHSPQMGWPDKAASQISIDILGAREIGESKIVLSSTIGDFAGRIVHVWNEKIPPDSSASEDIHATAAFFAHSFGVLMRQTQLTEARMRDGGLKEDEIWVLAQIIEQIYRRCRPGAIWKFRKKTGSCATRSIVVDPCQQLCYVSKKSFLGDGMCKKVTMAVALPFNSFLNGCVAAKKVSLTMKETFFPNLVRTKERCAMYAHELMITMQYPFFPQVFTILQYEKSVAGVCLPKLCVFEECMIDGNKMLFANLDEKTQIQFVVQVVRCLALLGKRIHGDMKPSNVLFQITPTGEACIRLTDGGGSCVPCDGERNYVMDRGFYGSLTYTAPEMYGRNPAEVDWYKAEAWALGCSLYYWLFAGEVYWGGFFTRAYNEKSRVPQGRMEAFTKEIEMFLRQRKGCLEKEPRTVFNEIAQLCFALLEINPACRTTVLELDRYVERLCQTEGHPFARYYLFRK